MVSVIITTKNRKQLLLRALNSVLLQTILPQEIIIIDDGSDDENLMLESEVDSFNKKVKVIYKVNYSSLGGNYSRNLGASISSGEILMFLDDDDCWLPYKIQSQLDVLNNKSEPSIGLVYTGKQYVLSSDLNVVIRKSNESSSPKSIWSGNFPGSTSGVAIRRKLFFDVGMFDINLKSLQDYDLWIRILSVSTASWDKKFNLQYTIHDLNYGSQVSTDVNKHIQSVSYLKSKYESQLGNLSFLSKRRFMSRMNHLIARAYRRNNDYKFIYYYILSLFLFPSIRTLVLPFYYK